MKKRGFEPEERLKCERCRPAYEAWSHAYLDLGTTFSLDKATTEENLWKIWRLTRHSHMKGEHALRLQP